MRKTLTPRISIQNQYDDNIDLDPNKDSDWITTVSPGLALALESKRTRMNLNYASGFSFYRNDSSRDNARHQGTLLWEEQLSRQFRLEVTDTFIRSEDPILVTEGQIEEVFRDRRVYYRNNGQVNLLYEFSNKSRLSLGYRNRYLDSQSSRTEDSIGHEGFLDTRTWFGPQFGIELISKINRGKFEQPEAFDPNETSEDFYQYALDLVLNYRRHSSRLLYAKYNLIYQDFDEPAPGIDTEDYRVHLIALGLDFSLSPRTAFNAEGGYFIQDFLNGHKRDGILFEMNLDTRKKRASLRLQGSSGYAQEYFSSENLGSAKFYQTFGSIDYLLTKNLRFSASANYRWMDYFEEDRKDEIWRTGTGFSFSFWRRLSLSLDAVHSERDSTDGTLDFKDNRIMLSLTGAYPVSF